jgi:hypothetical protein
LVEAAELFELRQDTVVDSFRVLAKDCQPSRGDLAHAPSRPFQQTSMHQIRRRPAQPVVECAVPTAGKQLDQVFRCQAELFGQ